MKRLLQIQAHLITSGRFFNNSFWTINLLKHSADFGSPDYTVLVFKCINNPGTFCVNAVVKAYSNSCVPDQAVVFYFQMIKNGFMPNSYTFVSLFGSCAKTGCVERGGMCHGLALKNGVDFELPVMNSLINMYGCFGAMDCARNMFVQMSHRDLISWNSIVSGHVRSGDMSAAHELFDIMPERNVVSWNIMISGYSKSGNPGCSLKLFREMMKSGFRGNDKTMASVLTACGRSSRFNEGRSVHGYTVRTSLKPNIILDTALIDLYSKCQKVEVAQRVFDSMADRNLVCWNAMILGHCIHGKPEEGIKLFTALVNETVAGGSISPDEITFIGVICACVRAELLTEGRIYFRKMIDFYKIKPNFAHYWCMANLYAGAELTEEAEEILRKMPEDNDNMSFESIMWVSLLSLCRFQGAVAMVERLAKSFVDMDPQDFSRYQFLLNVYAVAGQWEDVARVRELMKKRRMGRMPGCRLVDLKEVVEKLKVGHFCRGGMKEEVNKMMECRQSRSLATVSKQLPWHKNESGS